MTLEEAVRIVLALASEQEFVYRDVRAAEACRRLCADVSVPTTEDACRA